ncbi:hypothetical protein MTO96_002251 [Rhipicephalus appendiculatus]
MHCNGLSTPRPNTSHEWVSSAQWRKPNCFFSSLPTTVRINNRRHQSITIRIDGSKIPSVQQMLVVGLHVHTGRSNIVALERLAVAITQTAQFFARISTRKDGMKGKELVQLLNAFVTTRISHVLPYIQLLKA